MPDNLTARHFTYRHVTWFLATAAFAGLARGFQGGNISEGSLFVHPYWAQYYLLNHQDGFSHRALLGTLLRHAFPSALPVLVLNGIALTALAIVAACLFSSIRHFFVEEISAARLLAASVLLSGWMLTVCMQTAGDLLHVCFAVVVGGFFLALRLNSRLIAATVSLLVAAACVSIHEASLLLLVPALVLGVTRGRVGKAALMVSAAACAVLLAWNSFHTNAAAHLTYVAHTFPQRGPILGTPEIYKGFRELRSEEWGFFFSTNRHRLHWLIRFVTVFLPGIAALVATAYLVPAERFRRLFAITCGLFVVSLPIYVIAHDWPRFLALTLTLALVVEGAFHREQLPLHVPGGATLHRIADTFRSFSLQWPAALAATLLLQLNAFQDFRYMGMPLFLFLPLAPLIVLCIVAAGRLSGTKFVPAQDTRAARPEQHEVPDTIALP